MNLKKLFDDYPIFKWQVEPGTVTSILLTSGGGRGVLSLLFYLSSLFFFSSYPSLLSFLSYLLYSPYSLFLIFLLSLFIPPLLVVVLMLRPPPRSPTNVR